MTVSARGALLPQMDTFRELDSTMRARLVNAMAILEVAEGDYIVEMGQDADAMYVIQSGEVVCHKGMPEGHGGGRGGGGAASDEAAEKEATTQELIRLGQGQVFGESAMEAPARMSKRVANVVAVTACRLAMLAGSDVARIVGSKQSAITRSFNLKVLQGVALLADALSGDEMAMLADAFEEVNRAPGEVVIAQGTVGEAFYIIKAGAVRVIVAEQTSEGEQTTTLNTKEMAKLTAGAYFGERSLLTSAPTNASIVVSVDAPCAMLRLTKRQFEALLGPLSDRIDRATRKRKGERTSTDDVEFDHLREVRLVGVGSFATVKLMEHTPTGKPYALKTMHKAKLVAEEQVEPVIRERELLQKCEHPFLQSIIGVFATRQLLHLLLDYVPGGELFTYLGTLTQRKKKMPESQARLYAAMITSALAYLHARYVAHRDIKSENLLFDAMGYLKLIDFGCAKKIKERSFTLCALQKPPPRLEKPA